MVFCDIFCIFAEGVTTVEKFSMSFRSCTNKGGKACGESSLRFFNLRKMASPSPPAPASNKRKINFVVHVSDPPPILPPLKRLSKAFLYGPPPPSPSHS